MPQKVIIGICGYARAGKDTVADALVDQLGFVKRSFADGVRMDIWTLNPIVDPFGDTPIRYQTVIGLWGYEAAKDRYPEIRRLLQVYGTDIRRTQDPDVWVNRLREWVSELPDGTRVVVPDVRFHNEVRAVDYLIRVDRPGVGPVNGHVSDSLAGELPADDVILNDGTIESLSAKVILAISKSGLC